MIAMTDTITIIEWLFENPESMRIMQYLVENGEKSMDELKEAFPNLNNEIIIKALDKFALIDNIFIREMRNNVYGVNAFGRRILEITLEGLKERAGS